MRVGKITANLQTREVKVVEDDCDTMNKRVTIVLSLLLVLSIAPSAPAFSVCGVSGPGEEKNIRLTITGEDCGEEEKHRNDEVLRDRLRCRHMWRWAPRVWRSNRKCGVCENLAYLWLRGCRLQDHAGGDLGFLLPQQPFRLVGFLLVAGRPRVHATDCQLVLQEHG